MRRATKRAVLAVSGAGFVLLALTIVLLGTVPLDRSAREAVLALAAPPVVAVLRVVNYAGSWRVLLPATLLLPLAFRRARGSWWLWIGLMIVAPATEGLLKIAIGRPRPEHASMGFPSGHATAAAAFFGAVWYLADEFPPPVRRIVRGAAVVVIVLVAVARVMLRAHWPSDAVAGIFLGVALAAGAALLDRRHAS